MGLTRMGLTQLISRGLPILAINRQLDYSRSMPEKRDLPPIEKRGGYSPQSKAPSPAQAPSKPADAGASARPAGAAPKA
jgi:hypothetical protein